MADKSSRLADILKQEYKSKGIVGGLASSGGKRILEKLDIRNALFGGTGVGSIIGRKIFGKGYSAINEKSSADKLTSQSAPILAAQSDKLDVISMNTQIAAKNSMALPSMARDLNVMRQNIIKMVKLQGGTPTNKADAFFSKAKDREAMYENLFNKDKPTTPTKIETPEKSGGFLGTLLSGFATLASLIVNTIKNTLSSIPTILSEVFSIKNMMSAFGVAANTLGAIFKIVGLVATNPVFLAIAGIASAAAMLSFMRGNYDAEKTRYMELAEKKKKEGSLSVEEDKELRRLERPNFQSEARTKLNYDPIAGVESTAKTPGQIAAENRRNSIRQGAPDIAGAGRGKTGGPTAEQSKGNMGIGMTFNDMTYEQQDAFLKNQAKAEGSDKPGTVGNRHNNPGNIIAKSPTEVYPAQAKFGGVPGETITGPDGKTRTFVRFPTWEAGVEAQRDLWSRKYGNVSLEQALNKWVDPASHAEMANYQAATLGDKVTSGASSVNGSTLASASQSFESIVREAMMQSGGATINNVTNNNSSGGGGGTQMAQAEVMDVEVGKLLTRMWQ